LIPTLVRFWTEAAFRLRGARRERLRIGEWDVALWRLKGRSVTGAAPAPWVLLHGLAATTAAWAPLVWRLRAGRELVLPELSSLGGTRGPRAALAVRDGVEVVAGLVRALFPGRAATVAGLSLGGWIATRLAIAHPDLVGRLALLNAGGYRDQDWGRIAELMRVTTTADAARLQEALFARVSWPLRLARGGFRAVYNHAAARAAVAGLSEGDAFDGDDLARIRVPAAVIWGDADGLFAIDVGRRMASHLPDGHFYALDGAGHVATWERPAAVLAALEDFDART
jgi:2-hydroxy-6-oxonona-2,4-dienedioate hydrolase